MGSGFPLVGRTALFYYQDFFNNPLRAGRFFSHTYGPKKKRIEKLMGE